ncbi:hypothetical protein [Rubritalea squalenifaciens]|nr:hypothetical protein [Rubritalea squalenifaciens]
MSLLLLIALGAISMSSNESRSALQDRYQAEAEANARLALQTALGKLQEYAGQDQRVTATAGILDSDPSTPTIDSVANPYWTGVWKTTDEQGLPLIKRNDLGDKSLKAAGLLDDRTQSPLNTPALKQDSALAWLVSSPAVTTADPISEWKDEKVTLVSSPGQDKPEVIAPLVKVNDRGSYAWWVGDEGVKARLAIDHPYNDKKPDMNKPDEGYSWLTASPGLNHSAIQSEWKNLEDTPERMLSRKTLALSSKSITQEQFHDYTVYSEGVLADSLRGGLRKDLSSFLLEGDQSPLKDKNNNTLAAGITLNSRLIGPMDAQDAEIQGIKWDDTKHQKMSPRFGLLKSWVEQGVAAKGNNNQLALSLPKHATVPEDAFINNKLYDLQDQTKASIKPLMVEGSIYKNLTYYKLGDQYRLRLHVYPRVVLWNPYNTTITTDQLVVYLRIMGVRSVILNDASGNSIVDMTLPSLAQAKYGAGITYGSFAFTLEPTTFEPGECLVFSKASNGSTRYEKGVVALNKLSAKTPAANKNFYVDDTIKKTFKTKPTNLRYRFYAGGRIEDLSLDLKAYPSSPAPRFFNMQSTHDDWVAIQKINYHFAYGDGRNPERGTGWRSTDFQPIEDFTIAQLNEPYYKTKDGARLRWIEETPTNQNHLGQNKNALQSSLIINNNAQAHLSLRTPQDSLFSGVDPKFFGNFVRDVWDPMTGWNATAPIPLGNGKFGGNPFASPQQWSRPRYTLFDLPDPEIGLTSLAQLQHAPVSALSWQPSYATGNSWANPRAPLTGTAPNWDAYGGWNSAKLEHNNRAVQARDLLQVAAFGHTNTQWRGKDPDQLQHDLSYEINHQLWDRFYLSGNKTNKVKAYLNGQTDELLKNARLRRTKISEENDAGYHESAGNLAIVGAFNVNSTSIEAWKALLLATKDAAPDQDQNAKDRAAFPRSLTPLSGAADTAKPDQSSKSNDAWSGYRSLSDQEIDLLAEKIVAEVKQRGPFISLSDFVNRRLRDDETGLKGALQAAIDAAELNKHHDNFTIDSTDLKPTSGQNIREIQKAKPMHTTAGAPNYLQQADLLQPMGPYLSARSDTFVIRTCGQARDSQGKIKAEVYCEAVVQRRATPIAPDTTGLNPLKDNSPQSKLGRRFEIVSFRWLNKKEL